VFYGGIVGLLENWFTTFFTWSRYW